MKVTKVTSHGGNTYHVECEIKTLEEHVEPTEMLLDGQRVWYQPETFYEGPCYKTRKGLWSTDGRVWHQTDPRPWTDIEVVVPH